MGSFFDKYIESIKKIDPIKYTGTVSGVKGLLIESTGPRAMVGEICTIQIKSTGKNVLAEVVGLDGKNVSLMPFGSTEGIEIGNVVVASGALLKVPVGNSLLGRVLDGTGQPSDGKGGIIPEDMYPALNSAPNPVTRMPNNKRVVTGVRAIDGLLTVAKGQRIGIFAGSGVGKSTLISMIARNALADVNVIALVGERGREVNAFIEGDLGPEGLAKSVVVVATGDAPSISRLRAAYVATAIAEYFRDQKKDVMLFFDNVTRFAHAQREIGNSIGELPAQGGYPPSVFDMIPKLLERTGNNDKGTITAFYAVLVDGDDFNEPITDKVRGTLDGHIVLNRKLAGRQHYPAIDIPASISRLSSRVTGKFTKKAVSRIKSWIALYSDNEKMILNGMYEKGNSLELDEAVEMHQKIEEFLCQEKDEPSSIKETLDFISELSGIQIPEEEYSEQPLLNPDK